MIPVWTVDFETMPIGPRPEYFPPKPVGVAIRPPDSPSSYLAWGHPSGNNCTAEDARVALCAAWFSDLPVVFHHANFDIQVAMEHFGLPMLPWDRIHDTMFLAFLMDPYARSLGLKQLAEIWLHLPPDERDVVNEWVLANKDRVPRFPFIKNSKGEPNAAPTKKNAGAWIGFAPGEIVGPYACGDTDRTWGLFQTLMPLVEAAGMREAYDVERQVLPILMRNEQVGVRIDLPRLEADIELYRRAYAYAEDWLRWRLQAPGLNLDADREVADVLERHGIVTEWVMTASGQKSVSKKNLHPDQFADPQVASVLGYRNRLQTCLDKHMQPMLDQAQARGGRAMGEWNQVASDQGGTRTGRPSMYGLNLLNVSKNFEGKPDGYVHPDFLGLPPLPLVRRYIIADEGCVILKRDFSGQELHVFGHYENGELQQQYLKDPNLDVHNFVGEKINALTRDTKWTKPENRTPLKVVNFQSIYGGGVPALQAELRWDYARAKEFKDFHNAALPGRQILADTLSMIVRQGRAIRTYGGRLYVRPPFKKQKRTGMISDADYILINYLCQGSSADITKRAMIRLTNHPDFNSNFMLQVYDEMNISAPIDDFARQMEVLRESMEGIPLRTGLPTDGEWGFSWGEMNKIKGPIEDELAKLRIAA